MRRLPLRTLACVAVLACTGTAQRAVRAPAPAAAPTQAPQPVPATEPEAHSADELVALAREAREAGDGVRAQQLFARAGARYERAGSAALSLDPPPLGVYPGSVTWSPDGNWLALAEGPYVSVLSADTFAPRLRFEAPDYRRAARAQFSRDSSSLLVELCELEPTTRCELRVHRLPDGALRCSIPGPRQGWQRALSADGSLLADAFDAALWDVRTCTKRFDMAPGGGAVLSVELSRDGRWLAVPGAIWDAQAGIEVARFEPHAESEDGGTVYPSLAFRSDGKVLATLGAERTVELRSVPDGKLLRTLPRLKTKDLAQIVSFDERELVVTSERNPVLGGTGAAWVLDSRTAAVRRAVKPARDLSHSWQVEMSLDHRRLLRFDGGPGAGPAEIVAVETGNRLDLPTVQYASAALSPDGRRIALLSKGSGLKIFDATSGAEMASLPFGQTASAGLAIRKPVALGSDGTVLTIGGDRLEIWDLLRGTRRATIARQAWQLAVSSRNQLAAAGYDLYLIDLEHGLLQHEIATGSRTFLIGFDAAGEHLASALEDRTLRVFDARTGAALATFTGLDEVRELETLTFAPDGKSLDLTGPTKAVHADLVGGLLSRPPFQAPSGQPKGPGGQPFHCDLRPLGEGLEPAALAISNDCSTAAIGSPQGPIVLLRPSAATSPLLFDVAAAGEAAFVQVPLRGPSSRPLERILNEEWPGLPAASIEPLGPDARALLVCRVGPKVLPLEVCEERLITQGALRAFFGRH